MSIGNTKRFAVLTLIVLLVAAFAVPTASAASYSKVYGQTQAKVRVRESASTNATIIDNVVKDACVYVTDSKTSGGNTFIKVKYRAANGDVEIGWICQSDGKETYVKILSNTQTKNKFNVSGGDLPSKRVGTFTEAQRKASAKDSDNTYLRGGSSGETVKGVQTKLKAMGYYYGEITGNVGAKTEAAIKQFQRDHGLTADGIAGPQTIAKIDAAYSAKGSSGNKTSSTSGGSGLRLGSQGTAVRNLQQDLTTLGFYWAEITGNFGAKTETAVKRFQEEHGLTADGVAGTKTLAAIERAVSKKGTTSAGSASSGSTLQLNSQGTKVTQLQKDLKALGYYYAEITGNFGAKTETAVKKFQSEHGLTADGVVGNKTQVAITEAVKKASGGSTSGSTSGGSTGTSSSASGLRLGSTGDAVRALQKDLTTLGYYYGDITGHYGGLTQQAVSKFQKDNRLTQDGVAGASTIAAIANKLKSSGSTSASGGSTGSTLREGDSGSAVTELQTMLKKLGYYYGEITGSFGSLTRKAVRSFQDKNGLTVDGIAGPATINKLRTMTGGSSTDGTATGTTVTTDKSYGRITKDNVYLRSSYSTTSSAKTSLDQGTLVRISKTYSVSGVRWYYISVTTGNYSYTGYVRGDMLEVISESDYNAGGGNSNSSGAETIGVIRVTGSSVRLRYEPSTDAKTVGYANKGDTFYYVDTVSGWFQTRSGYWISKDYVEVLSDDDANDYISGSTSTSYRYGSTGAQVSYIQEALTSLGYYSNTISGHFGSKTEDAVKAFQRDHGMSADGVVGEKTMAALMAAYSGNSDANVTVGEKIYTLDWFTAKSAGTLSTIGLVRNKQATLTDLRTGKSLRVHVQSTGNHADVEPLTAADTTTLCSIYGVSSPSRISYVRRPMLLSTSTGHQLICSIYGQPHGAEDITNNNFDGQFCLHFVNSRTHNSNVVDSDHQKAIQEGVRIVEAKGAKVEKLP